MADKNWKYFRLRFGKDEQVIRVSPWAADQLSIGVGVATIFSDHPDHISIQTDNTLSETFESENQWQGTAGLPFLNADELGPQGPPPPLGPLIGFDPTGTVAWLVEDENPYDDEP